MLENFAAGFLVFAFSATALFHLAIAFGAPVGEYAYGGQRVGKLSTQFRVSSVFSFILLMAFAGHYLAQLGVLSPLLGQDLNELVNWLLVGFSALAALMNNITRSSKERRLWGGPTIAMLIAAFIVAL